MLPVPRRYHQSPASTATSHARDNHYQHHHKGNSDLLAQLPSPRRPSGRLHESRSANPSPSLSARSTQSPSARCPQASPSRHPAASALLPSRPSSGSKTVADSP